MKKFVRLLVFALAIASFVSVHARAGEVEKASPPAGAIPTPAPSYANVRLYLMWQPDGTPGTEPAQCNGMAHGEILTRFGEWSDPIKIFTNQWAGGCIMRLAVIDPDQVMKEWRLSLSFTGPSNQCRNTNTAIQVPVVRNIEDARNAPHIGVDTTEDGGGCTLMFSVLSDGPQLALRMGKIGGGRDGCSPWGERTSALREPPVQIFLDTDGASSACKMEFNLFSPYFGKKERT